MSDEAAPTFEEAFDGCYRAAYRVAFKLLDSRADAEDTAQEAMARAYVRWRSIRGFAEPWVSRVAMNLVLDSLRKRRRAVVAYSGTGSEDALAVERMDLASALSSLPRRQREVVGLRFLADKSEADVARLLGCSVGTVKQHAHRGLQALRSSLAAESIGDV